MGRFKHPFHFDMKDNSLFAFAGLWDRWRSPDGSIAESCTILTTTPNQLITDVHDRMPGILRRDHYQTWLTAPPEEGRGLSELLVPFEAELMTGCEVSVNSPRNDMPSCVGRVVPTNSLFRASKGGPRGMMAAALPLAGAVSLNQKLYHGGSGIRYCCCAGRKALGGADVAHELGATGRGDGYFHGYGYVVTWAPGHLGMP